MIKAEIVGDSVNEFGNRITSMLVTFPRIILAEFNTHRMFSRNSASSRAIPFGKLINIVEANPFIPIAFQKDHKGMQGTKYFTGQDHNELVDIWKQSSEDAISNARSLYGPYNNKAENVTKQLCNRLLEPFMWTTVLVTATEWENFFASRCPQYEMLNRDIKFRSRKDYLYYLNEDNSKDNNLTELEWLKTNKGAAEIHMMTLAENMWDVFNESKPKLLQAGEWHIPFKDKIVGVSKALDNATDKIDVMVKIATVMAARTSYTVVGEDLKPLTYERMLEIHNEMLNANPKHMSPFEHCAQAMTEHEYYKSINGEVTNIKIITSYCNSGSSIFGWSGNFHGFKQYRKMIPNENIIK